LNENKSLLNTISLSLPIIWSPLVGSSGFEAIGVLELQNLKIYAAPSETQSGDNSEIVIDEKHC